MADRPDPEEPPGSWLRQQREAAAMTQEELAARSGLSARAIGNLERGTRTPYPRSLRLVTGALGLPETTADVLIARYRTGQRADSGLVGSLLASPGAVPAQAGNSPVTVPRQLPPTIPHFAGRTVELTALDRGLERASGNRTAGAVAISAICGMAGVGKTALALRWAHQIADRFPDGQLYVNLRGYEPSGHHMDAAEALRGFLDALGVAPGQIPADLDGQAGLYRSLLADKRMLIFADNARDAAQVRPLLPGAAGCLVLVTSRSTLAGLAAADGACTLNLGVLTVTEAVDLLSARLGSDRVAAELAATAELVELCSQLPLALAIVAARAAASGWPLAVLAAEVADARGRLAALSLGDAAVDMRAVSAAPMAS